MMSTSLSCQYWDAVPFTDDQYAQARVGQSGYNGGIAVRCSGTAGSENGYALMADGRLLKLSNGAVTLLNTFTTKTAYTDDVMRLEVIGTQLMAYLNGAVWGAFTDSSITSGSPGIVTTPSTGDPMTLTNWEGGDITSSGVLDCFDVVGNVQTAKWGTYYAGSLTCKSAGSISSVWTGATSRFSLNTVGSLILLQHNYASASDVICTTTPMGADQYAQAQWGANDTTSSNYMGVAVRVNGNSYYAVYIFGGTHSVSLVKVVNGVSTTLTSTTFNLNPQGYYFRLEVVGKYLILKYGNNPTGPWTTFINGGDYTTTPILTSGTPGIVGYGTSSFGLYNFSCGEFAPSLTLMDSFPQPDGALESNWKNNTSSFAISNHTIQPTGGTSSGVQCVYNTTGLGSQHYCEVTVASIGASGSVGPLIRKGDNTTASFYGLQLDATQNLSIVKVNAGSSTVIKDCATTATVGDVIRIAGYGTTLLAYKNGQEIGRATDAGFNAGFVGVFADNADTGFTLSNWKANDWWTLTETADTHIGDNWDGDILSFKITNKILYGISTTGVMYTTQYCPPDQYAKATVNSITTPSGEMGIAVRASKGGNGYYLRVNQSGQMTLGYIQNWVDHPLATSFAYAGAGSVIELAVFGNTLIAYKNGAVVYKYNDVENVYTAGSPGIYYYTVDGSTSGITLTQFFGGSIAVPYYAENFVNGTYKVVPSTGEWQGDVNNFQYYGTMLIPYNSASNYHVMYSSTAEYSSDQYAEATVSVGSSQNGYLGVAVRGSYNSSYGSSSGSSGYALLYAYGYYGSAYRNVLLFGRVVNGAFTSLMGASSYLTTVVQNDVIRLEAVGSTITAYKNGIELISVTDWFLPLGRPGCVAYGSAYSQGLLNWAGGNLEYTLDNFTRADGAVNVGNPYITDDFSNRSDGGGLSRGWVDAISNNGWNDFSNGFTTNSQRVYPILVNNGSSYHVATSCAGGYEAGQYAQFKISGATTTSSAAIGVAVRGNAYGINGYALVVFGGGASRINIGLWKITNGAQSAITPTSSFPIPAIGDVLRLEVQGDTLTVYNNGVSLGSWTDSDFTTGAPGIAGGYGNTSLALDEWQGGNLSGNPVGDNWRGDTSKFAISGNTLFRNNTTGRAIIYWTDTFGDDQFVQATLSAPSDNYSCGLVLKAGTTREYILKCYQTTATLGYVTNTSTGAITQLSGGSSITGLSLQSGDVVRLELKNSTFTIYQNGTSIGTFTDSVTPPPGGAPGLQADAYGAGVSVFSSFTGGDLPLPAIDVFNRADTGLTWGWAGEPGSFAIKSNQLIGPAGAEAIMYPVGNPVTDQYSQVKLGKVEVVDAYAGASVRAGSVRGYTLCANAGGWILSALDVNLVSTPIQSGSRAFANGDVIHIEVTSLDVKGYHNGVLICSYTDTQYGRGGAPGVYFKGNGTFSGITEWEGGGLRAQNDTRTTADSFNHLVVANTSATNTVSMVSWGAGETTVFSDNQFAEVTFAGAGINASLRGPMVRANTRYVRGYIFGATGTMLYLNYMSNSTTSTTLYDMGYPVSDGDVLRLEIVGNTITCYVNGNVAITYIDYTPRLSGAPGVYNRASGAATPLFDTFSGGNLPVTAQPPKASDALVGTVNTPLITGSNWLTATGFNYATGRGVYATAYGKPVINYWIGAFTNNQYAQCTVGALAGTNNFIGLTVRASGTDITTPSQNGYIAYFGSSGTNLFLAKLVNSVVTVLAYSTCVAGDVLRLEAVGNLIQVRKNGLVAMGVRDNTFASGNPGIYARNTSGTTAVHTIVDFSADNMVAPTFTSYVSTLPPEVDGIPRSFGAPGYWRGSIETPQLLGFKTSTSGVPVFVSNTGTIGSQPFLFPFYTGYIYKGVLPSAPARIVPFADNRKNIFSTGGGGGKGGASVPTTGQIFPLGLGGVASGSGGGEIVTPAPILTSITVSPTTCSLASGFSQQMTALGGYKDGSSAYITGSATWSSSDESIATISSSGIVTAKALGNVTITATSGAFSATAGVTVGNAVVTSISITPETSTLVLGDSKQMAAMGTYSDMTTADITNSAVWSADSALGVTSAGMITATSSGVTAKVYASTVLATGVASVTIPYMVTDNFDRPNGAVGGDWKGDYLSSAYINNNSLMIYGYISFYWAITPSYTTGSSAAQFSQATFSTFGNSYMGVAVRCAGTGYGNGYYAIGVNSTVYVYRIVNGSASYSFTSSGGWKSGDVIKLTAQGSQLTLYRNGTQVWTGTDTYYGTGFPGICMYAGSGTTALDDWSGGDL
jgi:hypothetical protein